MGCTQTEQVRSVAGEISRYLTSKPDACDTVEGIGWWLVWQRYEDSLPLIQEALDFLESSGEVTKQRALGGKLMYRKLAHSSAPHA